MRIRLFGLKTSTLIPYDVLQKESWTEKDILDRAEIHNMLVKTSPWPQVCCENKITHQVGA